MLGDDDEDDDGDVEDDEDDDDDDEDDEEEEDDEKRLKPETLKGLPPCDIVPTDNRLASEGTASAMWVPPPTN